MPERAVILFAHGARDPRWAAPFEAVLARVRARRPDACIKLAFLELMEPGLQQAIDDLVTEGQRRIDVLPLFLGTGGHLRRDLPRLRDEALARHPGLELELLAAAGEQPALTDALAGLAIERLDAGS